MPLAVRSTLRLAALSWTLAAAGCDADFSPDWHPASPPDGGEPEAGQGLIDGGTAEAAVPPPDDAGEEPMRLYECKIPPICPDGGGPNCMDTCWASARDVMCTVVEEPCPWIGYTVVDCKLCNKPPIR